VYGQLAERAEALEALWRHGPTQAARYLKTEYPLRNEPLRAVLAMEAGQEEEACQLVNAILGLVPGDGRGLFWLSLALAVTSSLCSLNDPRAEDWAEGLRRYEGSVFAWFSTDTQLARIDAAAGRWTDADARFTRATESLAKSGLVLLRADALYHHALMLRKRRRAGDRAKAVRLLEEASEAFGGVGAAYMRDKIDLVLRAHGPGRPPSTGRGGLTGRELSVLELLARGQSTREIAQLLVVSERTVSRHLENIYAKLGVTSRTAAVARAVENGLVDSISPSRSN
jgi:DNA-binding CsgD family transcriptional regulator